VAWAEVVLAAEAAVEEGSAVLEEAPLAEVAPEGAGDMTFAFVWQRGVKRHGSKA
jgi:hypothetical protein